MKNTFLIAFFFVPCPSKLTTFALKIQLILRPFRLQKIEFPRRHCKLIFNTIQPQANKLHEMGARRIFYIKVFLSMYTYIYCTTWGPAHTAHSVFGCCVSEDLSHLVCWPPGQRFVCGSALDWHENPGNAIVQAE